MSTQPATRLLRAHWLGLTCLLVACQAAAPTKPQTPSGLATPHRIELCKDWNHSSHGPVCVQPITEEEQRHSQETSRFEYEGSLVVRRVRINGRGGPELDDDECSEYRYRYKQGVQIESTGYRPDGTVCDHTLISDDGSRATLVDAWGREFPSKERIHTQTRIERDAAGFATRVRFFSRDGSPVKAQSFSHEVRYEHDAKGRQTKVCNYDELGKPALNNNNVHCARSRFDARGNLIESTYFDLQEQPSESYFGTHSVKYGYDAFGNRTSSEYLRLDGTPISIEGGSCAVVRFQYDERGFRSGGDCFDGAGHPARWREGNASWRSIPDAQGRISETRYFDPDGNPIEFDSAYASYEVDRDENGHVTERRYFLANGKPGQKRGPTVTRSEWNAQHLEVRRSYFDAAGKPMTYRGCAATETEFNQFRQVTRSTCRDVNGELSANSSGTSITEWTYDSHGLLIEKRYYDAKQQPGRSSDHLAREKLNLDAFGIERSSTLLAADETELHLPRYRVLSVYVRQPNDFWPARTREASLARIEAARARLVSGVDFTRVLQQYGDEKVELIHPGDMGYQDPKRFYSAARVAVEGLAVGQYSEIVELPYAFTMYQRTE